MAAEAEASREARAKVWTLTQEMSSFSVVANDSEMSIRTGCACGVVAMQDITFQFVRFPRFKVIFLGIRLSNLNVDYLSNIRLV